MSSRTTYRVRIGNEPGVVVHDADLVETYARRPDTRVTATTGGRR